MKKLCFSLIVVLVIGTVSLLSIPNAESKPATAAQTFWTTAGQEITWNDAITYTTNFTESYNGTTAQTYSKELMMQLLSSEKVYGMRVAFGTHKDGPNQGMGLVVLIPLDEYGNEITDGSAAILERGTVCPPVCP